MSAINLESDSLQRLVNQAAITLGNPVLVHNMEYELITCTENVVTDDPIWNEYTTLKRVGEKSISFFTEEGFMHAAAATKKTTLLTSDKLKYNRIYCKLFNAEQVQIGCAVVLACNQPLKKSDYKLFERVCSQLNKEITLNQSFTIYGQEAQERLINALLLGELDMEAYVAHIESLYIKMGKRFCIAALDTAGLLKNQIEDIRDLLKKAKRGCKLAVVNDRLLAIVTVSGVAVSKKMVAEFEPILERFNLRCGVSDVFENLFNIKTHYQNALAALSDNKTDTVSLFDKK